MMRIKQDDLWFCDDCTIAAVNGDFTGFQSDEQVKATEAGLERLGPHLVPDFDSDTGDGHRAFDNCGCDCCDSGLAGEMHRFATLEPVPPLKVRELTADDVKRGHVKITITLEVDDVTTVRGSFATGDDAEDKRTEDEILERLNAGEIEAWCCIVVKAKYPGRSGASGARSFFGYASLGGCSYESPFVDDEELREKADHNGLIDEALADLNETIRGAAEALAPLVYSEAPCSNS